MKSAEDMYQGAKSVNNDDNYQEKINKLQKLVETYPEFVPAHDELGAIYYQIRDYEKALNHFEQVVTLNPHNIKSLKNLGDLYYTVLSRSEDALNCYHRILEIEPLNSEANLVAANLLVSLHRFKEAKQLYQKILSSEPWRLDIQELIDRLEKHKHGNNQEDIEKRYQEAQKMAQNNDQKGAIQILEQIVNDDSKYAIAHNDLGVLRYQSGEIEEAQVHYEKAVELDPDNLIFKKNLAEFYLFVKGEIKKTLEIYVSILKDHPYDIETLMAAAKISEKFERIENAKVFYEAILDIEPWNMEASNNLEALKQNNGLMPN